MASNYYGFTHAGTQYGWVFLFFPDRRVTWTWTFKLFFWLTYSTEYTATNQYANTQYAAPTPAAVTVPQPPAYGVAPNQAYTISGYTRPANQPAGGSIYETTL